LSTGACSALGLFVAGENPASISALAGQLGVTADVQTVYADDNYTAFTPPITTRRLLLGVGELTPVQATAIGATLVATGHANTMIRIMWEMNGNWLPWGVQALSAAQYIAIYQAAEHAFAAVPGNHFQYIWNINAGSAEPGRTEFDTYPGNAYVSNIGIDFYDYDDDSAIPPILAFAAAHGKPVSFDEWGLNGTDDPAYINYVASIVKNLGNNVTLQAYFSDGSSNIEQFPKSEAAYRDDFAGC
jgi:beta-mannanase